jgi:hypothetical protein
MDKVRACPVALQIVTRKTHVGKNGRPLEKDFSTGRSVSECCLHGDGIKDKYYESQGAIKQAVVRCGRDQIQHRGQKIICGDCVMTTGLVVDKAWS